MSTLIDQYGQPINPGTLQQPQTARVALLANRFIQSGMARKLTPARISAMLAAADEGDLVTQADVFDDMIERDAHLSAELHKRHLAILGLEWDILAPRHASAAEQAHAEWAKEVLQDTPGFDDLLLSMMRAVGHGFAPIELTWNVQGREWLPAFNARPQNWFRLNQARSEFRLADASADGLPLDRFAWILHQAGQARTGYLGRLGLLRTLAWPWLYKNYSIGDFAELLETYGLPIIIGKYPQGASEVEKDTLFSAVAALGHDARAIMPVDMQLEVLAAGGAAARQSVHLEMADWAEKSMSKAILGATLTSQADGASSTNALGLVHNEVRADIAAADAAQIAGTLTRDLIYPLLALNRGGMASLRRCPRLAFITDEAANLESLSKALPPLVAIGVQVPANYVNERAKIPLPKDGEAVLAVASAPAPAPTTPAPSALHAALAAAPAAGRNPLAADSATLAEAAQPVFDRLIERLNQLVKEAPDLPALQSALLAAYGHHDSAQLAQVMAAGFALAELKGIDAARAEAP
jgi:phage gp29-like protein